MEKENKSFVVFFDWYNNTTKLDNAQFGELFRAIFKYVESDVQPEFDDGAMEMAFNFIKNDIDRNQTKYLEIKQKRSEAGRKGGAPIGNNNASKNKQNKHNVNVNDKYLRYDGYETKEEETARLLDVLAKEKERRKNEQ